MNYPILTLLFITCFQAFSQQGKVVVKVNGIDVKNGGELSVGFFSKDNFPKVGKQSFGKTKEISAESAEIVFEQVPVGEYGIAIFQDIDRNKTLKTNFVGLPTEPIGFSNDARMKFGPPSFADAKITVENGKILNLVVKLR
jgi:uncharacterized protein (DUF2141 family)